jgi:hypothetical protein
MLFQKRATIEAAPLQDEALLFHPQANRFFVLNGTASYIWEQLPGPLSVEEVADRVCRGYGVARPDALRDVQAVLDEMLALSIVDAVAPETPERAGVATGPVPAHDDARAYERPRVQAMSEEEVLSSFQLTQAGITWWTM